MNEEAEEGTSQVPPAPIDQHEPQDEADTQVSGITPLSLEKPRETNLPPIPPLVVPEQDLGTKSAVQLLTRLVVSQAQRQASGILNSTNNARV